VFAQAYAKFYAKGGAVKTLPGFDAVKPIPAYKPPQKRRKAAKSAETLKETPEGVTLHWIAEQCGYSSRASIASNSTVRTFLPAPITGTGQKAQDLYSREEAEEAVKKIMAYRKKVNRRSKAVRAKGQEND
jgi:hypothetical protein